MTMKLLIKNAMVYDPKNDVQGETRALYIQKGRVSKPFKKPDKVIDAKGMLALPGGVEAGTTLSSYGLPLFSFQQNLTADPQSLSTAYARLGYTHLHESMMFPTTSLMTHHYLTALPYQDGSASLCLTLREFGGLAGAGTPPEWVVRFIDTCAQRFRALNIRLPESSAHFRESALSRFNIPASKVLEFLAGLSLNLPFLMETTSRLLDETLPATPNLFFSHIGRAIDGEYAFKQATSHMASGTMRGDIGLTPAAVHYQILTEPELCRQERLSVHLGLTGPLRYAEVQPSVSQVSLSLKLATHPEHKKRLAFSSLCLGPQAGEFYPTLFRQLFDANDSYTISDFVWQTRVMPATFLGLEDKGHLGVGAVGDVALYQPRENLSTGDILGHCHTLIKGGQLVMEGGEFTGILPETRTFFRAHDPTERDFAFFAGYFRSYPRLEHLDVPDSLGSWQPLPLS